MSRIDTSTDAVTARSTGSLTSGEAVFVARPRGIKDDDGVLLTVGSSPIQPVSELTVWDARTLDVLARMVVPIRIPLGLHGGFQLQ